MIKPVTFGALYYRANDVLGDEDAQKVRLKRSMRKPKFDAFENCRLNNLKIQHAVTQLEAAGIDIAMEVPLGWPEDQKSPVSGVSFTFVDRATGEDLPVSRVQSSAAEDAPVQDVRGMLVNLAQLKRSAFASLSQVLLTGLGLIKVDQAHIRELPVERID